jgi:DNA-binding LytR/AlgR family response regulator
LHRNNRIGRKYCIFPHHGVKYKSKGAIYLKFTLIIDENREEEIIVYAKKASSFTNELESFVKSNMPEILGYLGGSIVKLSPSEVYAFSVEEGKVFAYTENKKFLLQKRLYQVEEAVGERFVKINQSCMVNISRIERFEPTIGGSLMIVMKNGYRDYVSRRQMRTVKERIGLKR